MTKVGRLFEEEKIAYGEKLVAEAKEKFQKEKEEAMEQQEKLRKQSSKEMAKKMLEDGISVAGIQRYITNLTYEEIEALKA